MTDGFTPQRAEAIAAFTVSGAAAMTPEEKDAVLEARLLHVPVSARTEQLIVAQTSADQQKQIGELRQVSAVGKGQDPLTMRGPVASKQDFNAMDTQAAVAAGLIIGSPEFQRR